MNQFLLGRFWLWIKPKLHGLLTLSLVIFLIFYIHGEYLSYVEFSEKLETNVELMDLTYDPDAQVLGRRSEIIGLVRNYVSKN